MTQPDSVAEVRALTRVALVACSGILGDLIRQSVSAAADLAVIEDLHTDEMATLSASMRRIRPDVVVWQLQNEPSLADHPEFFGADSGFAVLAVVNDGRRGSLWRLRPHRTAVDPLSIDGLVGAIRASARPESPPAVTKTNR
ncbi:hypothetical protein [Mycobacterium sp.]|uniref:hypothetical protein n=1 Tax=Mycobacterium sp. TaxID=1785 RepID=UPI003D117133